MSHAPCPMPHAPCPMPHAPCPMLLLWSRQIPAAAPAPRTTPFPEEKSILGVIYGVLLWADMNAATPLGAWGRSVIPLDGTKPPFCLLPPKGTMFVVIIILKWGFSSCSDDLGGQMAATGPRARPWIRQAHSQGTAHASHSLDVPGSNC